MPKFTDKEGREWNIYVDIPVARKIRKLLDVDILDLTVSLPKLAADPILLCDVLYVICSDQADQKEVTDENFGAALFGEPIEAAGDALVEALINFTPPRQQKILRNMREISLKVQDQQAGMIQSVMGKVNEMTLGTSSPLSQESSDTSQAELSES